MLPILMTNIPFLLFCRFLQIDEKLYTMNTVSKMKMMYDNYEQDTSINEYVSPIERTEENDFVDAVLTTPVMRYCPMHTLVFN